MKSATGITIRVDLPAGDPDGLWVLEKLNWTGRLLVFPRNLYAEVCERPELRQAGVYVLWSPGRSDQLPTVSIGGGSNFDHAMELHPPDNNDWARGAWFATYHQSWHKDKALYLAARLAGSAVAAEQCLLTKGTSTRLPALAEADTADCGWCLSDLIPCLQIGGANFFGPQ